MGTPAKYRSLRFFGPFHRLANPLTQDPETMRVILLTGELWGKAPRGSDIPAVKAYFGPLREDEGFEFFTTVEPDAPVGGPAFWRERADGSVQVDDGWAKIRIVISRVNQEF